MPRGRRSRAAPVEEIESDNDQTQLQEPDPDDDEGYDGEAVAVDATAVERTRLARKIVRYALSCEYGRKQIRRQEINSRVLEGHARQFNIIFKEAQVMLQEIWGMEMVELPKQEKLTLAKKRAAAAKAVDKPTSTATGIFILKSTLDAKYRIPAIIPPSRVPSTHDESTYTGFYSMMIALIYIAGGSIEEDTLTRHLRRMNADQNTPLDTTDKTLQRALDHGYLVKSKDSSSGEEIVEYHVGPRGKTEVGKAGVAQLIKTVYGEEAGDDLSARIERTLALTMEPDNPKTAKSATTAAAAEAPKKRKRASRRQKSDDEEEEAEEEEEEEDD